MFANLASQHSDYRVGCPGLPHGDRRIAAINLREAAAMHGDARWSDRVDQGTPRRTSLPAENSLARALGTAICDAITYISVTWDIILTIKLTGAICWEN